MVKREVGESGGERESEKRGEGDRERERETKATCSQKSKLPFK